MIICGWYTPNYAHYVPPLKARLQTLGHDYHFTRVDTVDNCWERITLLKPAMLEHFMALYPNETIVLIDVDCEIMRPLGDITRFSGDVCLFFRTRVRRCGVVKMSIRSGTMAIRSTPEAIRFVRTWKNLNTEAPKGTVDQTTLPVAMASTPGLQVAVMDAGFCAVPADDHPSPYILHDSASRSLSKMSRLERWAHCIWSKLS